MASTKKRAKGARTARHQETAAPARGSSAAGLIVTALAGHESSIRKLAEVVVNLHDNVRALRALVEVLADGAGEKAVRDARRQLDRVALDE
jgi:hypothetical protein